MAANESNTHQNYMDRSVEITPETILNSVREAFEEFQNNKERRESMRNMFTQMAAGWVSVSTLVGGASMAFADEVSGIVQTIPPPQGVISYTTFLQGIQQHLIDKVRIDPTGRYA